MNAVLDVLWQTATLTSRFASALTKQNVRNVYTAKRMAQSTERVELPSARLRSPYGPLSFPRRRKFFGVAAVSNDSASISYNLLGLWA